MNECIKMTREKKTYIFHYKIIITGSFVGVFLSLLLFLTVLACMRMYLQTVILFLKSV